MTRVIQTRPHWNPPHKSISIKIMAIDNNIPAEGTIEKFSSHQMLVIVLLAMTQFTVILDFMVMSPLGDLLMKSMRLSTTQFGAAVSAYAFSAGIAGLLTAGFADRFD